MKYVIFAGLLVSLNICASDFSVTTEPGDQVGYGVGYGNGQYLAIWEERAGGADYDIKGVRVDTGGAIIGSEFFISTSPQTQFTPDLEFDGNNFLVVYYDNRYYFPTDSNTAIYATFVDQQGVAGSEFLVRDTTKKLCLLWPHLAWNGSKYLVVFYLYDDNVGGGYAYDCLGQIVNSDGTNEGNIIPIAVTDSAEDHINVASCGGKWLTAFTYGNIWEHDIYGRMVSEDGSMEEPFIICNATEEQDMPDLAWNGSHFLVVWEDWRSGGIDVYGVRIDTNGTIVPPEINISAMDGNDLRPGVASDGKNWLVVWWNIYDTKVHGRKIDSDGNPIGDEFLVSDGDDIELNPYIGCDGTKCLVIWSQLMPNNEYDVYGNLDYGPDFGIKENKIRVANYVLRAYPNPFVRLTDISYQVSAKSPVSLSIYDAAGRLVKQLVNEKRGAGYYTTNWNAKGFSPGIYFAKIKAGDWTATEKLILIR